ncbi:uncharacterized protein LOC107411462 [Ziziphus jujuba]|uniref:Uncharacterized protein LOC107411462 n=1 Tax=Ziziphus jujuba TaxID=326968 RepID=A0A6P3ZI54_ZIZJJ|nr:uncharacterized protein LOC107411462 [Ziziphus jujuba]
MVSRRNEAKVEFEADPATWAASEEKIFIRLMVKEVQKGNRSSTTFTRKGWKNIEQEFCDRTCKRYNNSQFRNKFNQLRTRYHDFSKLLKEPGFSWDPMLNNVSASESVWESFIKANKKAKRFRKKGCAMFNDLGIIYGNLAVQCKGVFPLSQYPLVNEDHMDVEDSSTNATPSAFLDVDSNDNKDYTLQNTRGQRSPTPTSHVGGKMDTRAGKIGDALKEWADAMQETNITPPTSKRVDTSLRYSAFSITNCVKCLESIEGVDGGTYIKAIKMFKDADWREMFMAMSAERRLLWLNSLE